MNKNIFLYVVVLLLTGTTTAFSQGNIGDKIKIRKVKDIIINPVQPKVWSESFENWDGKDLFWLPEGWSRKATPEYMTATNPHTWFVNYQTNEYVPAPVDGKVYAEIMYNDKPQDEWLYTCSLTPKDGDWLQYYVLFRPFLLYKFDNYDYYAGKFTKYEVVGDLQTYISVDDGEYEMVGSLADEYLTADAHELYETYAEGYITNKKVSIDMAPYVGHKIKVGFRYVATDGDSMWLDALTMGKPTMTTAYNAPEDALFMGMSQDMVQGNAMYLPDNAETVWQNTSSLEAISFNWTYPTASDYTKTMTSTEQDLTTTFADFRSENSVEDVLHNTIPVPVLDVDGIGGLHGTFSHAVQNMKIGGKAQQVIDGKIVKTGASTCDPTKGIDIVMLGDMPVFGINVNGESPWTKLFGLDKYGGKARLTAILNQFPKPAKEYKVRGLWIQGIGDLVNAKRLTVNAYRRNVYGSLDEKPVGTAIIDLANIHSEPLTEGSKETLYSLPFIFPDPITVNEALWYKLEGLEKAFTFFAPLQTDKPDEYANGYFDVTYEIDGEEGVNTYNIGNLILDGKQYNNSFFFNLDMAYGDCDDWGHIDIEIPQVELPELEVANNTMKAYNVDDEDFERQLPMRCGFYDEGETTLTLYPCIGELYEYSGGPFYSADIFSTYHYEITMPQSLVGDTIDVTTDGVRVRYYDLITGAWVVDATSGKVFVERKGEGMYNVYLHVIDNNTLYYTAAKFNTNDAWRWRKYGEVRPNPNEYKVERGGKSYNVHPINSCVVDTSVPDMYTIYFCETPDITTVAQAMALTSEKPVIITASSEIINEDRIWGFSAVKNSKTPLVLDITYNGATYNYKCGDDIIDGGNADINITTDPRRIIATSTLYGLRAEPIDGYYPNWKLKYEGVYYEDNVGNGIERIENGGLSNEKGGMRSAKGGMFNAFGQRVSSPASHGLYIVNGKKILIK